MSKKITIGLNTKDINRAIREIEKYKKDVQAKTKELEKRIAEALESEISTNFNSAVVDDKIRGGTRPAVVKVSVASIYSASFVIAQGEDAIFCEFGAGVYHNGGAGSSPHPYGSQLGFTIGSYGQGKGKQKAWGYYDTNGNLVITRGTPATMPMYNAIQMILPRILEIAKEVFNS